MNIKKYLNTVVIVSLILAFLSSCSSIDKAALQANSQVQFTKNDFELSERKSAEAQTTTVLGIDFKRIGRGKQRGKLSGKQVKPIGIVAIPVIGQMLKGKTPNYAIYNLMEENKGYDVIFYPQYKTIVKRPLGFGFLWKKTKVKVTARLGKLKL